MPVIWGLDLKEMQWGKFKSSYMWNNEYHRRRTKFIIYQCAMIFCVVSESLGTAALSDYLDQQKYVEDRGFNASIDNNDFIGIFSYNIFVGVYVATIFGAAFFFDLFWPERHESGGVKMAWRICSLLTIPFVLSAALGCTIILATHEAHITGVDSQLAAQLLAESQPHEPLVYKHNPRGIASVVFVWLGFVFTVASTILMWMCISHIDTYGPFSSHVRDKGTAASFATDAEKASRTRSGQTGTPNTAGAAAAEAMRPTTPTMRASRPNRRGQQRSSR